MTMEIDTANRFLIGVHGGDRIVALRPIPQSLSKDEAILLAAYLVALTDEARFLEVLAAIKGA